MGLKISASRAPEKMVLALTGRLDNETPRNGNGSCCPNSTIPGTRNSISPASIMVPPPAFAYRSLRYLLKVL